MLVQSDGSAAIAIDAVQRAPLGPSKVIIRLRGRCRGTVPDLEDGVSLVVESDGRIHRFPALGESHVIRGQAWSFSFAVPAWFAPRLEGRMMLAIGDTIMPVEETSVTDDGLGGGDPEGEGPDVSHQMVVALRSELQERVEALARVGGVLADAQAEIDARAEIHARLESAQFELREELGHLRELVGQERVRRADVESRALSLAAELDAAHHRLAELESAREDLVTERDRLTTELSALRAELAEHLVAGEAATTEAEALRAELERLGHELTVAREGAGARDSSLAQAQALLAEARALTASLREK